MPAILIIFGAKYLIFVALIIAIIFCIKLVSVWKKLALLSVFSFPISYIIAVIARHIYNNPRPFVVGRFKPLIDHAADNGFPSDHTLLLAVIASVLFPFSKKASITMWILTILVAYARVLAGVHHPVDVIASAIIAMIVTSATYFFLNRKY